TDSQADDSLKTLAGLDVEPVEFSDWSAVETITVKDTSIGNKHTPDQLTDSEFRLLKAIVDNPMLSSSRYVKLARISPNTLSKLRPVLIEKGFIREHIMDSGSRGRSKRIWEPLDAAKQAVANHCDNQEQ
ncbi:MAG: hypothetical protein KAR47_18655, partial [Planctomycetes bacterium]|nr:hypothetical protein [Planctomycetota bacterium]